MNKEKKAPMMQEEKNNHKTKHLEHYKSMHEMWTRAHYLNYPIIKSYGAETK